MSVPFSVRCVSCHARLKITDAALIGTIAACPRCNSLVQIDPPQHSPEPAGPSRSLVVGSATIDSQAVTEDGILAATDTNSSPPNLPSWSNDPNEPTHTESSTHSTPVAFEDPSKIRRRRLQWILAGTVATLLLVLASLVVASRQTAALPSKPPLVPATVASDDPDSLATSPTKPTDPVQTPVQSPDPVASPQSPTTAVSPPSIPPPDLVPSSPLDDLLQSRDNQSTTSTAPRSEANPAPAEPLTDLPPELAMFTELLDLPGQAPGTPALAPGPPPGDQPLFEEAAIEVIDPMLIATPPPRVNIDNAMKLKIAIDSDGYPFSDVCLVVGELTGVPIQIDWVSFDLVGVNVNREVRDSKPGWKTIGDWLADAANQLGATIQRPGLAIADPNLNPTNAPEIPDDDRLVMTIAQQQLVSQLAPIVNTKDFADEQASAEAIIDGILAGVSMDERNQMHLRALATDSLRRLRGIKPQITDDVTDRWTADVKVLLPNDTDVKQELALPPHWPDLSAGQSGSQLDAPITMAGLLRRTSRLNSATCLINWDDAKRRRLSPVQLVMPFAGVEAGQMLRQSLAPLGLQVRVVDEQHWWVGTQATYDRLPILVRGEPLGNRRIEILEAMKSAAMSTGTTMTLQHDPVSDCYLAVMPRFLYRQLPRILLPFKEPQLKEPQLKEPQP